MKLPTLTLAAAMVMAATGCETAQQKIAKGYHKNIYGEWVPPGERYFGDATPEEVHRNIIRRRAQAFDPAFWRRGPDTPVVIAQEPPTYYPALSFGP